MEFLIKRDEVLSVRTAARNLYGTLDRLEASEGGRFVLLDQKNDLRAVLLSTDAYSALLHDAGRIKSHWGAD